VTPSIITAMSLPAGTHGVLLTIVAKPSPAYSAGLRGGSRGQVIDGVLIPLGGDVVTKADGQDMKGIYDLILYMQRNKRPGDKISLTIIKGSNEMVVTVTLGMRTG
jgi:S1-C subfamily serine protease